MLIRSDFSWLLNPIDGKLKMLDKLIDQRLFTEIYVNVY